MMCDQKLSSDIRLVFIRARKLQIERIENMFAKGFNFPQEICLKYRKRYLLECATSIDDEKWPEIYNSLFFQFWAEIEQNIDIPEELNHLDQITLFGEVCLGKHSKVLALNNMHFKEDSRDKLWSTLEAKIQSRAKKKDSEFVLGGKWKKFLREQDRFKIFEVDGEWVRNNLSVIFEHGGHGYVFEFIPLNEIWVETHHPKDCGCKNVREDGKMSQQYSDSVVIHEIIEFKEMEKGLNYWEAHQIAQKKELEIGFLKDPYTEVN